MNPKQIANIKKSYADMDKTDEIDAFVIADYLRFGRNSMSIVKEEQFIDKAIERIMAGLTQTLQSILALNQFRSRNHR